MPSQTDRPAVRTEHDLLGDQDVPADVYYGVHTARALENFPISGVPISRHSDLVVALASVKQAAAESNQQLGQLDSEIAEAIIAACIEIRGGSLHDQFVVDQIQGGAGTSTNMNANEVIANRALEILGHPRGDYRIVHPLEHVNLGQSTNDVYPTAVKVALGFASRSLEQALRVLAERCSTKALEFGEMLKLGRTQLQDAGTDDPGPGIRCLRGDHRRGRRPARRGIHADRRDQPRRHRDRHRTQRPPRIRSTCVRSTPPPHRPAAEHRRQPRRGHL